MLINQKKVIKLYEELKRCDEVSELLGCHAKTVSKILKKNGIKICRYGFQNTPRKRKYSLNESRFLQEDGLMFYFLGFLNPDLILVRQS